MWKHRNDIEHANDIQKAIGLMDAKIQEEINKGCGNNEDIDRRIQEGRFLNEEGRSLAYKKGWLRGIQAVREREQRRAFTDSILRGMRTNMRRFLQRGEES